jgi:hypothetical protein
MKTTLYLFTFGLLITLFSCGQPNEKKNVTLEIADTLQINFDKKETERLEKKKKIKEQYLADSLRLDKVLKDAIKIANGNISKERFIKKYEVSPDSITISVEINLDFHFTKSSPHLIIRRNEPSAIYIDIYSKGNQKFEKVLSHEQWNLTYRNDTIQDINGDGLKDFVVNWYGSSGCCLKAFTNVYLLRQDKNTFSEDFEFINPTFSPNEKIIRGVCYGHPGQTEIYKYKWIGESIDTIEYVAFQTRKDDSSIKTGKIVISNNGQMYSDKFRVIKILNNVPNEYKKIDGYDWFTGKGYE